MFVLRSVSGVSANRNKQGDERMAIRHGTACKSNIPEWAGEGVGIVGIVTWRGDSFGDIMSMTRIDNVAAVHTQNTKHKQPRDRMSTV